MYFSPAVVLPTIWFSCPNAAMPKIPFTAKLASWGVGYIITTINTRKEAKRSKRNEGKERKRKTENKKKEKKKGRKKNKRKRRIEREREDIRLQSHQCKVDHQDREGRRRGSHPIVVIMPNKLGSSKYLQNLIIIIIN